MVDFRPERPYTASMIEHEDLILARLGSRFALRFNPRSKYVFASPLGIGFDRPLRLEISALNNVARITWPFSPGRSFDYVHTRVTLTSVQFTCVSLPLGIEFLITFIAPFYPQNERISCAPFFYLDLSWRDIGRTERANAEVKVALFGRETEAITREGGTVVLKGDYQLSHSGLREEDFSPSQIPGSTALAPLSGRMSLKETTFTIPCETDGNPARACFVLAAFCDEPVLEMAGEPHRLHYLHDFGSLDSVIEFAKAEEAKIKRRTALFDNVIASSSLGRLEKDLIARSFQNFLSSTWWTGRDSEADWFGCWNEQAVHNGLDDEYRASLFYLSFWPELLEKQLARRADWAVCDVGPSADELEFAEPNPATASFEEVGEPLPSIKLQKTESAIHCRLPSSFGSLLTLVPDQTPEASESALCQYLLLLFSHWRWSGSFDLIENYFPLIKAIASYLVGFHSASAEAEEKALEPELSFHLLCALNAAAVMADEAGDEEMSTLLSTAERKIKISLDSGGKALRAAQSLLHQVMCDRLPELSPSLLRRLFSSSSTSDRPDIASTGAELLLHDVTAAYFGFNFLQAQSYYTACTQPEIRPARSLSGDLDNAEAWGLIQALLGLKFDRVEQTLFLSPLSVPTRLPLIPLADWEQEEVPWVEIWCEGNQVKTRLRVADHIKNRFEVAIDPHRRLRLGGA
jgi:hypothetical protein